MVQRHASVLLVLRVSRRPHGVDFVDKNDARRVLLSRLEEISHSPRADADEHLFELATAAVKEWHARFARDRLGEHRLPRSRRADEKQAFG